MGAKVGISLAAVLVLGLTGSALAREAGRQGHGAKGYPKGFHQPKFDMDARVSGRAGPYVWPVADRYRAESRFYFGRTY